MGLFDSIGEALGNAFSGAREAVGNAYNDARAAQVEANARSTPSRDNGYNPGGIDNDWGRSTQENQALGREVANATTGGGSSGTSSGTSSGSSSGNGSSNSSGEYNGSGGEYNGPGATYSGSISGYSGPLGGLDFSYTGVAPHSVTTTSVSNTGTSHNNLGVSYDGVSNTAVSYDFGYQGTGTSFSGGGGSSGNSGVSYTSMGDGLTQRELDNLNTVSDMYGYSSVTISDVISSYIQNNSMATVNGLTNLSASITANTIAVFNENVHLGLTAQNIGAGIATIGQSTGINNLTEQYADFAQIAGMMNVATTISNNTVSAMAASLLGGYNIGIEEAHMQSPANTAAGLPGGTTLGNMMAMSAAYQQAITMGLSPTTQIMVTEIPQQFNLNTSLANLNQQLSNFTFSATNTSAQISAAINSITMQGVSVIGVDILNQSSIDVLNDYISGLPSGQQAAAIASANSDISGFVESLPSSVLDAFAAARLDDSQAVAMINMEVQGFTNQHGQAPQVSAVFGGNHNGVFSAVNEIGNGLVGFHNTDTGAITQTPSGFDAISYSPSGNVSHTPSQGDNQMQAPSAQETYQSNIDSSGKVSDVLSAELEAREGGGHLSVAEAAAILGVAQGDYAQFQAGGGMDFVTMTDAQINGLLTQLEQFMIVNDIALTLDIAASLDNLTGEAALNAARDIMAEESARAEHYPTINNLFLATLARVPTEIEKKDWADQFVAHQTTANDMRDALAHTPEAAQRLEGFYQTILGHASDAPGFDWWQTKLANGELTIVQIQAEFVEVKGLIDQVNVIYKDVFGSDGDLTTLNFYVGNLQSGAMTMAQVRGAIEAYHAETADIQELYNDVLDRDGEVEGIVYWQNKLKNGEMTLQEIHAQFEDAAVYTTQINAMFQDYLGRDATLQDLGWWMGNIQEGHKTYGDMETMLKTSLEHYRFAVAEMYLEILERPVDLPGRDYWAAKVESGELTLDGVRDALSDAKIIIDDLNELYIDVFGHTGDIQGQAYWMGKIQSGEMTLQQIQQEFTTLKGTMNAVEALYQEVLHKQGSSDAVYNYAAQVHTGGLTINQVRGELQALWNGVQNNIVDLHDRYLDQTLTAQQLRALTQQVINFEKTMIQVENDVKGLLDVRLNSFYDTILGRPADAQGLAYWKGKVISGEMSVTEVRSEFLAVKDIQDDVKDLYRDILGREGEMEGVIFWTVKISGGVMTLDQVRTEFVQVQAGIQQEQEVAQSHQVINGYYTQILGRPADAPGLTYWKAKVSSGEMNLMQIRTVFVDIKEVQDDVKALYKEVMGRDGDMTTIINWTNQIYGGSSTLAQVRTQFTQLHNAEVQAQEVAQSHQVINGYYTQILGRPADASGLTYWKAKVSSGEMSLTQIRTVFLDIKEVQDDVKALYKEVMGRDGDMTTIINWTNQIYGGSSTLAQVRTQFMQLHNAEIQAQEVAQSHQVINGYYTQILGRPADASGLTYWKAKVSSGEMSLTQIRTVFLDIKEVQDDVKALYKEVMGRDGDMTTIINSTNQIYGGSSTLAQVRTQFTQLHNAEVQAQEVAQSHQVISGYYTQILGRTADAPGLNFWKAKVASGEMTLAQVRTEFIEVKDITTQVNSIYSNLLGRQATLTEQTQWVDQVQNHGKSYAQINASISQSTEYYTKSIESYYQTVLGRVGDAPGVQYWLNKVQAGQMTLPQVRAEFVEVKDITTQVNAIYSNLLGRQATLAEQTQWVDQVQNHGKTFAQITSTVNHSTEYYAKTIEGYYNTILGRASDASGLQYWIQKVQVGELTLPQVRTEFVEVKDILTVVNGYYHDILGRTPDLSEQTYWLGQVQGGMSYNTMRDLFIAARDAQATPLVVDLDGDGVELIGLEAGVKFDMGADGTLDWTSWASGDDAILALDKNKNGAIDDHSELFGTTTVDGFSILAELDSNKDNVIDANDDAWTDLVFWKDANSDGISQAEEMLSADDVGIVAIFLEATQTDYYDSGSWVSHVSTVERADGSHGEIVDAWFTYTNDGLYVENSGIEIFQTITAQASNALQIVDAADVPSMDVIDAALCAVTEAIGDFVQRDVSTIKTDIKAAIIVAQDMPVFDTTPAIDTQFVDTL